MRILCLDTSTEAFSVALCVDGMVIDRFTVEPRRHAEAILSMAADVMAEAGLSPSALDAVAFGRGPGSFTGVRIGASVALGVAFAHDHPVIPVSTLAGLAQRAMRVLDAERVASALDARMGQVYWGLFERSPAGLATAIGDERVCDPGDVGLLDRFGWLGVGSGWEAYGSALSETCGPGVQRWQAGCHPGARDMLTLAVEAYREGRAMDAGQAGPVYLRNQVAVKSAARSDAHRTDQPRS